MVLEFRTLGYSILYDDFNDRFQAYTFLHIYVHILSDYMCLFFKILYHKGVKKMFFNLLHLVYHLCLSCSSKH